MNLIFVVILFDDREEKYRFFRKDKRKFWRKKLCFFFLFEALQWFFVNKKKRFFEFFAFNFKWKLFLRKKRTRKNNLEEKGKIKKKWEYSTQIKKEEKEWDPHEIEGVEDFRRKKTRKRMFDNSLFLSLKNSSKKLCEYKVFLSFIQIETMTKLNSWFKKNKRRKEDFRIKPTILNFDVESSSIPFQYSNKFENVLECSQLQMLCITEIKKMFFKTSKKRDSLFLVINCFYVLILPIFKLNNTI